MFRGARSHDRPTIWRDDPAVRASRQWTMQAQNRRTNDEPTDKPNETNDTVVMLRPLAGFGPTLASVPPAPATPTPTSSGKIRRLTPRDAASAVTAGDFDGAKTMRASENTLLAATTSAEPSPGVRAASAPSTDTNATVIATATMGGTLVSLAPSPISRETAKPVDTIEADPTVVDFLPTVQAPAATLAFLRPARRSTDVTTSRSSRREFETAPTEAAGPPRLRPVVAEVIPAGRAWIVFAVLLPTIAIIVALGTLLYLYSVDARARSAQPSVTTTATTAAPARPTPRVHAR